MKVTTRYFTSVFLGHSRHTDLYNSFTTMMDELSEDELVQFSMDGPVVNIKLLQVVQDGRKDRGLPHVLDIGSCGLHTLHGSLKTGIEKSEWKMKYFMKASFNILHDSPVGWDDYESVAKSSKFPLLFCTVRSIEVVAVADRLIEIWPNIKQIRNFQEKLPKSKQPSSKSYDTLKIAVLDELVIGKLVFF